LYIPIVIRQFRLSFPYLTGRVIFKYKILVKD